MLPDRSTRRALVARLLRARRPRRVPRQGRRRAGARLSSSQGVGAAAHAPRRLARARPLALRRPRRRDARRSRPRSTQARGGQRPGRRRRRPRRASARAGSASSSSSAAARAACASTRATAVAHGKNDPAPADPRAVPRLLRHHRPRTTTAARARRSPAACCCSTSASRDALPLLFDFLGVPDPAAPGAAHRPGGAPAPALRRRCASVVAERAATREPTVTLLEDLHWIDAASDAFLAQHGRRARRQPRTCCCVNFRPEYQRRLDAEVVLPAAPAGAARRRGDRASCSRDLLGSDPSLAGLADADPRAHRRQPVLHRGGRAVAGRVGTPRRARAGAYRLVTPVERARGARRPCRRCSRRASTGCPSARSSCCRPRR